MIINEHFLTQHNIFRIKHTELNEIYTIMSIRSFISGMIGIFIPIYLFTLGFPLSDILLVNVLMFAFESLLEYPSAKLMHFWGPKHNIALSLPVFVFYFWLLWTLPTYHWPLWVIAMTGGTTLAFYWQGYHYDFSKSKNKKKATNQISKMYLMIAILGAIAPFIGGVIAEKFGFGVLLGLVTFLVLFTVFPLLKNGEPHERRKFKLTKLEGKSLWRQIVSYGANGIEATCSLYIWPLFVFLIIKSTEKVGFITSASLLLTILITYYVGKTADHVGRCGYIKMGGSLNGLIYFVKSISTNIFQVFSLNILTSISHSLFTSPYVTEYYLHADEESRGEYIFVMEFWIDIFRVIYGLILYNLSLHLDILPTLSIGLLIAGFASFLIGLMPEAVCELPKNVERKIKVTPRLTRAKR